MNRFLCLIAGIACLITGCQSAEEKDAMAVDKQQKQYQKSQPVPYYDYSLERETTVQLYNMRNERVRTWTVWRSDYGMIEGDTASIGFPIPYDVQLTNPLQRAPGGQGAVIEQAEPNGLFSSKHTTATWIRSIVEVNGQVVETPIYVEGKVTCYPYPIVVDYEKNRVTRANNNITPTLHLKSDKAVKYP